MAATATRKLVSSPIKLDMRFETLEIIDLITLCFKEARFINI